MEIDVNKLYESALEQCNLLQRQVIELKTLYYEAKKELEELKTKDSIEI